MHTDDGYSTKEKLRDLLFKFKEVLDSRDNELDITEIAYDIISENPHLRSRALNSHTLSGDLIDNVRKEDIFYIESGNGVWLFSLNELHSYLQDPQSPKRNPYTLEPFSPTTVSAVLRRWLQINQERKRYTHISDFSSWESITEDRNSSDGDSNSKGEVDSDYHGAGEGDGNSGHDGGDGDGRSDVDVDVDGDGDGDGESVGGIDGECEVDGTGDDYSEDGLYSCPSEEVESSPFPERVIALSYHVNLNRSSSNSNLRSSAFNLDHKMVEFLSRVSNLGCYPDVNGFQELSWSQILVFIRELLREWPDLINVITEQEKQSLTRVLEENTDNELISEEDCRVIIRFLLKTVNQNDESDATRAVIFTTHLARFLEGEPDIDDLEALLRNLQRQPNSEAFYTSVQYIIERIVQLNTYSVSSADTSEDDNEEEADNVDGK